MKTLRLKRQTTSTATIFAIDREKSQTDYRKKACFRLRSGKLRPVLQPSTGLLALLFFFPSFVFAQVQITEIMYDTPGADTGHEWIELTNTGSETVDIGKYKLFENDTNHSLTLISGSSVLSAGQAAIVASDPNKFKIDNPTFSGTLFDSTFSLSNTGETLVIKDASSTTLNTASYSTTEDANGTGGTLQLKGSAFVAALASPGVYPGQFTPVPKAPVKEKAAPKTTKKSTSSSTAKTSTYSATKNSDAQKESAFSEAGVAAAAAAAAIPAAWLWGLGLFAVILLGVGGIFFIQLGKRETSLSVEEFTIE